ncbi:hypothetical protein [Acaryochloris sp. CCMEE 5410]|uniref:hypothetical protein n=1 Tax=Acaryochloris sp. CCMEE 5410 TaxID=310037 RepID=UPI0021CFD96B|nr:hypothetical protein [Acaryochloris sp. CCMEE 5410]
MPISLSRSTQLQRLLQQGGPRLQWLARFTPFGGGAPAWPALLQAARQHHLRLALTYGMTETAAQVATLDPINSCSEQPTMAMFCPTLNYR